MPNILQEAWPNETGNAQIKNIARTSLFIEESLIFGIVLNSQLRVFSKWHFLCQCNALPFGCFLDSLMKCRRKSVGAKYAVKGQLNYSFYYFFGKHNSCLHSFRLKGNGKKWTNQIWFKCVATALMFKMDS